MVIASAALWAVVSCVSGPALALQSGTPTAWPTDEWERPAPEEEGLSSQALAEAVEFAAQQRDADRFAIHSLAVVRRGRLVLDAYFHPFAPETLHDVASITKSVTSLLIGTALADDHLARIDLPVSAFFPQADGTAWDNVTIQNLLSMRSGYHYRFEAEAIATMQTSPHWVDWAVSRTPNGPPGAGWFYNSVDMHMLSALLQDRVMIDGEAVPTGSYAAAELFRPLGVTNFAWPADPQGVVHGWGDLRLLPTDIAKLGMLVLYGGRWEGRNVVAPGYLRESVTPQSEAFFERELRGAGYGYLWWVTDEGAVQARGRGGQRLHIDPQRELIVVTTGADGSADGAVIDELIADYITPAVVSDEELPEDPAGLRRLSDAVSAAATAPIVSSRPLPSAPAIQQSVDGKTYRFATNPVGVQRVRFDFSSDTADMRIDLAFAAGPQPGAWMPEAPADTAADTGSGARAPDPSGSMRLNVGLDGVYRFGEGRFGIPARARGSWADGDVFIVELDEIGNISRWSLEAEFSDGGDVLTLVLRERYYDRPPISITSIP